MTKVNPKDFLLNSDYEMDKIIYYTSGEMLPGHQAIRHNLKCIPLIFGVCAFNSDFSDGRMNPYNEFGNNGIISFQFTSNSGYINFNYTNTQDPNKKLYYRIYAFEPVGSNATVGATSGHAKELILNTDYNYCKLYKKGVAEPNTVIKHNFGYIPLVLAWDYNQVNTTFHWMNSSTNNVTVTDTDVIIKGDTMQYRIYYDEA